MAERWPVARMRAKSQCCGIVMLCMVTGGGASAAAPQLLSQRPPEAANTTQFNAGTSTIEPSLEISYRVLADAANAAADQFSGPRSGTTKLGCNPAPATPTDPGAGGPQNCVDVNWHVIAARNGTITVGRDGQGIGVAIPVKFAGDGGFQGGLAKTLQMNDKKFNGTFVVTISGVVRLDKSFCPKLENAATHFAWGTAPQINLVEKACLGVGNGPKLCVGPLKLPIGAMMTDQINRSLTAQVNAINGKIACENVRNELKQVWKTWSLPITLPNSPTFYANIEPKSLSIPGVFAQDDSVKVVGRLDVATSVSTDRLPGTSAELPENTPLDTQAGRFDLRVPLAIPYALLADARSSGIVNKPIRAGGSTIMPTTIEFFPSNDKLAVGVTFRADAPAKLRDRTATIWYTAVPSVTNDGQLIRLSHVAMTAKTDSPLWSLAKPLTDLPNKLEGSYAYDVGSLVSAARTKLNQALADPRNTGGAEITVANDALKLGRTALLPNAFVVEGVFDADVSVALQEPHS